MLLGRNWAWDFPQENNINNKTNSEKAKTDRKPINPKPQQQRKRPKHTHSQHTKYTHRTTNNLKNHGQQPSGICEIRAESSSDVPQQNHKRANQHIQESNEGHISKRVKKGVADNPQTMIPKKEAILKRTNQHLQGNSQHKEEHISKRVKQEIINIPEDLPLPPVEVQTYSASTPTQVHSSISCPAS